MNLMAVMGQDGALGQRKYGYAVPLRSFPGFWWVAAQSPIFYWDFFIDPIDCLAYIHE